jgi:small-conductance mechanosensitive channel
MATPPNTPAPASPDRPRTFGGFGIAALVALIAFLILCAVFSWTTRDAMAHLQFLRSQGNAAKGAGQKSLVDLSPWQTAQALAPLAVSAEETEFAHEAERLADHDGDQAFAVALRQASLQARHRSLTGDAQALSQKVVQLEDQVKQDQAQVDQLTPKAAAAGGQPTPAGDDLETAKAQLGLDSDDLSEARLELERATGDNSREIQAELTAHETLMRKYDSGAPGDRQVAILSAKSHGTLAARIGAWFAQRSRIQLLQQALDQTQSDINALTAVRGALKGGIDASAAPNVNQAADHAAWLAGMRDRSANRQILGIDDDRLQTKNQLAAVYGKWSAQVLLQHRIVFHMMMQSLMLIAFIAICMVLLDALVRRLMSNPDLDRRKAHILRNIVETGVQAVGFILILLVIFGIPQQMPTILGLGTAALTISLQDFILAFLGWFVLVGKNGIHIGDAVEIDGVSGEVSEVGLFTTTLLETGSLTAKEHLTGRRITFINSFAIRGKYFNFSTLGQWMWDEIGVTIPATGDIHALTERIRKTIAGETKADAHAAEVDWKRGRRDLRAGGFSTDAKLSLHPSAAGIEVEIRYVTRAAERFEVRNRLNQCLIDLLSEPASQPNQVAQAD